MKISKLVLASLLTHSFVAASNAWACEEHEYPNKPKQEIGAILEKADDIDNFGLEGVRSVTLISSKGDKNTYEVEVEGYQPTETSEVHLCITVRYEVTTTKTNANSCWFQFDVRELDGLDRHICKKLKH